MKINPRTPKKISSSIKSFIQGLGLDPNSALFIRFTQVSSEYRNQYCYNNCEIEVLNGGEVVCGWTIWEDRKKQFVEGEHHCVLRIDGRLVDITPRQNRRDERILFVPDNDRIAGRIDKNTWNSWSNHKSLNGNIIEPAMQLRLREIDENYSELKYVE